MRGLTYDKGSRSVPTVGYGPGMATADSPLERALAGGKPHPTGWFRLYFEDERWEWSPEVERLHGYEPGTAKPTTSMVLSHKHPEDYEQVAATLDDIRRTHRAFSTRHRIIECPGAHPRGHRGRRTVTRRGGEVIGTNGFYADVTFPPEEREAFISDAVAEIAANRAVIEQVKGVLMMVYRIDADAAFDLLKWRSQEANVKLRALAEQLLSDFRALNYDDTLPGRAIFNQLLLTVHNRVRLDA